ncbi:MAG: PepSY domain-containing protein [Steroidobacteraceae bacterium]
MPVIKLLRLLRLTVVLLAVGLGAAHAVSAEPPAAPPPAAARLALAAAPLTMDEAVKLAEQRFHARVVKAEAQKGNGRVVYVLRLLNEAGRVWTVRVDAQSGAVL